MAYTIPEGATEFNGHRYNIYPGGTCHSWDDAVEYCKSQGGHMAVINNAEENTFLYQYLQESNVSNAYFGLTDAGHEGEWTWVNGDPSNYRNWGAGEPNNAGGEHYAMFYNGAATPASWNDGQFGETYGDSDRTFICEWDGEVTTNSSQYDIVFIIDKSGSMSSHINSVKNNVATFVDTLRTQGIDVQLGLVEFDDVSDIKKYDMTNDVDTFITNVNSIRTNGSGYEYGLTAITDANNGALSLNLRAESNKEFIVVTDEPYGENNPYYSVSLSEDEVKEKLNNANVKLDVFGKKDSGTYYRYYSCEDSWTPIANATTGQLINGTTVTGQFFDIRDDFSKLLTEAVISGTTSAEEGTHQFSFAQWNYGFTPADATASLASSAVVGSMATSST